MPVLRSNRWSIVFNLLGVNPNKLGGGCSRSR